MPSAQTMRSQSICQLSGYGAYGLFTRMHQSPVVSKPCSRQSYQFVVGDTAESFVIRPERLGTIGHRRNKNHNFITQFLVLLTKTRSIRQVMRINRPYAARSGTRQPGDIEYRVMTAVSTYLGEQQRTFVK